MADTTSATFSSTAPRLPADWARAARGLLGDGRAFAAHALCREGLNHHPGDVPLTILAAAALGALGAVDQARRLLDPVLDHLFAPPHRLRRLHDCLRAAVAGLDDRPAPPAPPAMAELAEAMALARGIDLDAATCAALADIFEAPWQADGGPQDVNPCRDMRLLAYGRDMRLLAYGRDMRLRAFQLGNDPRHGLAAAVSCRLLGERVEARRLAERCKAAILADPATPDCHDRLATLAAAHLLLGERADAAAALRTARSLADVPDAALTAAWRRLAHLRRSGMPVPDDILDLARAPGVVVFAPGQFPHLPPDRQAALRAELERRLDAGDIRTGYALADGDGDLLFVETMLDRGAQVHLILPRARDDMLARAAHAGGRGMAARWRNALALAASVIAAVPAPHSEGDDVVAFAGRCLHGLARLHAERLGTVPVPLTLAEPATPPAEPTTTEPTTAIPGRMIGALLVATIHSPWTARTIPDLLDFLACLRDEMQAVAAQPILVNSREGTVIAVAAHAVPLADYALALRDAATRLGREMRLWLDAGPMVLAPDPFGGAMTVHAPQAAACPVAVAGPLYASRAFAAMLAAEQPEDGGMMIEPLADDSGVAAYHLHRPPPPDAAPGAQPAEGEGQGEAAAPPEPPQEIDIESALAAVAELMEQADAGGRRKTRRKKPQDPAAPELALGPMRPG